MPTISRDVTLNVSRLDLGVSFQFCNSNSIPSLNEFQPNSRCCDLKLILNRVDRFQLDLSDRATGTYSKHVNNKSAKQ
ncbi:hypothetical protein T4B_4367 [Trichinella pseudospiralis]|uniref:Uncharacterized protein n=1 Tax=Trichinella pseudospiralis TaxID=6337 RepID=A0A0V1IGR9_TRIPS|nr:hypothetical protein T4B_12974 [Trichinella pseudospiralis]KRZ26800.1 hypothetical protein T4B_4367 [Trichinella pseudospiralis]